MKEAAAFVVIGAYVAFGALGIAWMTVLPTIGLLWSIGWLK